MAGVGKVTPTVASVEVAMTTGEGKPTDDGSPTLFYSSLVGSATVKGKFHPNEDRVAIYHDVRKVLPLSMAAAAAMAGGGDVGRAGALASLAHSPVPPTLILVADGHDGSTCADFITTSGSAFVHALDAVLSHSGGEADWQSILTDTFAAVEAAWATSVATAKRGTGFRRSVWGGAGAAVGYTSGACLTACLVLGTGVTCANVGDCRAVLRHSDGELAVMTEDHRCSNDAERRRILDAGGFIRNNRVIGILEPTRTIGDLEEKARSRPGVITAVPDTAAEAWHVNDAASMESVAAAVVGLEAGCHPGAGSVIPMYVPKPRPGAAVATASTTGAPCTRALSTSSIAKPATPSIITRQARLGVGVAMAGAGQVLATRPSLRGGREGCTSATPVATVATAGGGVSAAAPTRRMAGWGEGGLVGSASPSASTTAPRHQVDGSTSSLFGGSGVARVPRAPPYTLSMAEAVVSSVKLPVTCLLVATDGVWDVLTVPTATAVVVHALAFYRDAATAANELIQLARRMGSTDDISAAVVCVHRPATPSTTAACAPGLLGASHGRGATRVDGWVAAGADDDDASEAPSTSSSTAVSIEDVVEMGGDTAMHAAVSAPTSALDPAGGMATR